MRSLYPKNLWHPEIWGWVHKFAYQVFQTPHIYTPPVNGIKSYEHLISAREIVNQCNALNVMFLLLDEVIYIVNEITLIVNYI